MKHLHFLPIIMLAAAFVTGCNKDKEYHQMYLVYPTNGMQLVSGEGGGDSLVFLTTESFTITTSVNNQEDNNAWYSFPADFESFNNTYKDAIIQFTVPVTFQRNTTNHLRTVVFHINAGDYSIESCFIQDTIHTDTIATSGDPTQQ